MTLRNRGRIRVRLLALAAIGAASACGEARELAVSSGSGAPAAPWFEEVSAECGIDFVWQSGHIERCLFPEIMGGGAALFDMDGDGDLDVYLVQGGDLTGEPDSQPTNVLYENRGDGTFLNVSSASGAQDTGYGMGVAVGDFDDDGREDLYVTNVGGNVLLRNVGGGRFVDVTESADVAGDAWSTSAAFLDYDRDGDLDLFVVNYIFWSVADELTCSSKLQLSDYCSPKSYAAPAPDVLYRNDGDGSFTDVSAEVGLRTEFGNGLGIVCADFDGDGFEDIFVANDGMRNQLWINDEGARFHDRALAMGCAVDQDGKEKAGMGTHAIDVDDDGDEDLLIVNLTGERDTFLRNDGKTFSDRTPVAGLAAASRRFTRFGTGFADFDQDGLVDLYQANGRVTHSPDLEGPTTFDQPNMLFRGEGGLRFSEVEPRGGTATLLSATSRAAAFGDLNGDGAVDVLVVNRDSPAHVLFNRAARGAWIAFRVLERSGRPALGATVTLRSGERSVFRRVRSAYSYCAANDSRVHVGLGELARVTAVSVRWVDGSVERFGDFEGGRVVDLVRGAAR